MAEISLVIGVEHNFDAGAAEAAALVPRLDSAMDKGTERATRILADAVVRAVIDRTTMSPDIADAITEADVRGGRGVVRFSDPPPGGWIIRPRNKRALYWDGAPHPVNGVEHPGSRPYALIPRAADSVESVMQRQYDDEVRDVIAVSVVRGLP